MMLSRPLPYPRRVVYYKCVALLSFPPILLWSVAMRQLNSCSDFSRSGCIPGVGKANYVNFIFFQDFLGNQRCGSCLNWTWRQEHEVELRWGWGQCWILGMTFKVVAFIFVFQIYVFSLQELQEPKERTATPMAVPNPILTPTDLNWSRPLKMRK